MDPAYRVPTAAPAEAGLAWLRAQVVRFSEGDDHARRRALTVQLIEQLVEQLTQAAEHSDSPVATLLRVLGLPADLDSDVTAVAAAYQPHTAQSAEADAAADRLVTACGGRSEQAAALACVLVQTQAGMSALLAVRATGRSGPPIPVTRRVAPDGRSVEVDLTDAPFGRGHHRCPGERLVELLAGAGGEPGARLVTNTWAESPTEP